LRVLLDRRLGAKLFPFFRVSHRTFSGLYYTLLRPCLASPKASGSRLVAARGAEWPHRPRQSGIRIV
jgi:hypothetical protein